MKIAFDIDGTLSSYEYLHNQLRKFNAQGHDCIIWSGGGIEYAKQYADKYSLPARIVEKCSEMVDIAFDDGTEYLKGAGLTITVPMKVD